MKILLCFSKFELVNIILDDVVRRSTQNSSGEKENDLKSIRNETAVKNKFVSTDGKQHCECEEENVRLGRESNRWRDYAHLVRSIYSSAREDDVVRVEKKKGEGEKDRKEKLYISYSFFSLSL